MPTARGEYGPVFKSTEKIVPLSGYLLIRRDKAIDETRGGVVLPDTAKKTINLATVLAVGPGFRDRKGRLVKANVREGDRVAITESGGQSVYQDKIDGDYEELFIVTEKQIVGSVA